MALVKAMQTPSLEGSLAFGSYQQGLLTVAVRKAMWKQRAEEALRKAEPARFFRGFSRMEVKVSEEIGVTGRERVDEAKEKVKTEAWLAAERSAAVRAIVSAFGGELEAVDVLSELDIDALTPVLSEEVGMEDEA